MKKIAILLILFTLSNIIMIKAQSPEIGSIPLIGDKAPSFTGQSTMGEIEFPGDYFGKWKILFSHPSNFTSVCSSELLELAEMQDDFKKLNTAIFVISTDGINSHIEWVESLESANYKGRKTTKIDFPLIADPMHSISKKYGMIHKNSSTTKDVRAVFIINPDNRIATIFYYPMNIGRNMEEIKRTLIALQTAEKYDVYTPANWTLGEKALIPSPSSIAEAEKLKSKSNSKLTMVTWYLWLIEI